ncbi:uncharacterized protein [Drosophila kikkawai]|uniref:Uncharacterized protein n=1 Tax=Drosophila kikkawai TaxID=30033 RepID=A0ABM4GPN7_DROKI
MAGQIDEESRPDHELMDSTSDRRDLKKTTKIREQDFCKPRSHWIPSLPFSFSQGVPEFGLIFVDPKSASIVSIRQYLLKRIIPILSKFSALTYIASAVSAESSKRPALFLPAIAHHVRWQSFVAFIVGIVCGFSAGSTPRVIGAFARTAWGCASHFGGHTRADCGDPRFGFSLPPRSRATVPSHGAHIGSPFPHTVHILDHRASFFVATSFFATSPCIFATSRALCRIHTLAGWSRSAHASRKGLRPSLSHIVRVIFISANDGSSITYPY